MKLKSPAKINCNLKVLRRRNDGYCDIDSVMQTVSLFDELIIEESARVDEFSCEGCSLAWDEDNLIYRAVQLFRFTSGYDVPLRIFLDKKIPLAAGLGGGSSNAATVLYALLQLSGVDVPKKERLGSDVPFFFSSGRARCTGRGEILEHLPPDEPKELVIYKPDFALSTPDVYGALRVFNAAENDLEEPAQKLRPEMRRYLSYGLRMSGSGSCMFTFDTTLGDIPGLERFKAHFVMRVQSAWYEESVLLQSAR